MRHWSTLWLLLLPAQSLSLSPWLAALARHRYPSRSRRRRQRRRQRRSHHGLYLPGPVRGCDPVKLPLVALENRVWEVVRSWASRAIEATTKAQVDGIYVISDKCQKLESKVMDRIGLHLPSAPPKLSVRGTDKTADKTGVSTAGQRVHPGHAGPVPALPNHNPDAPPTLRLICCLS